MLRRMSSPAVARAPARNLHRFANPGQFLRLSGWLLPPLAIAGFVLTVIGLGWGLFFAPADWQQGDAVRIMYVHVPAAWLASAGYLALVGVVNLPIIKFSVDWWNTLHQPSTITLTGAPSMYIGMLWPLFLSAAGFTLGFAAIVIARLRAAVMERRIRGLLMARAQQAA